jgi:hypothetical protein
MIRDVVMRNGPCLLALALVGVLALPCSPISAQPYSEHDSRVQVDLGAFYDGLSPYGDWVEMQDYGWSWAPRVERGWRPYTRGQWVMTDDGWFWDSDEQFGWAAYHYGRWVNDPYYGWIWVPGTEWAPAWVSWRHGNGYTGWAPLPPRATWRTHVGLSIGGLDIDAFIGAGDYAFVRDRAFVDRGVYQRVLPPTENVTIINVTNNVTNYTVVNQRVVDGGIDVSSVERAVGRRVPRARTFDVDRADAPRRAKADEVAVFRPEVRAAPGRRPAQGTSLVKGDEPPARLVQRRKEREQERQQKGNQPEVTAKDVELQRRPGKARDEGRGVPDQARTHNKDASTQPQETQRQRDQQKLEDERAKRRTNAPPQVAQPPRGVEPQRPAAKPPQRDQARQDTDRQRAKDQEQKRLAHEPQANDQKPRDQKQVDEQPAKGDGNPTAQNGKRSKDAERQAKGTPADKGKKKPPKVPPATPPPGQQP